MSVTLPSVCACVLSCNLLKTGSESKLARRDSKAMLPTGGNSNSPLRLLRKPSSTRNAPRREEMAELHEQKPLPRKMSLFERMGGTPRGSNPHKNKDSREPDTLDKIKAKLELQSLKVLTTSTRISFRTMHRANMFVAVDQHERTGG